MLGQIFLVLFVKIKLLVKARYTSAAVNKLLLSGEERMALRADFHLYILLCGARFYNFAACAFYSRLLILRMDSVFHILIFTALCYIVILMGRNPLSVNLKM